MNLRQADTYLVRCVACRGQGYEPWHPGCGDAEPPTCRTCDGTGETMDPNACVERICAHLDFGEWQEAAQAMADLQYWLERDGLAPNKQNLARLMRELAHSVKARDQK